VTIYDEDNDFPKATDGLCLAPRSENEGPRWVYCALYMQIRQNPDTGIPIKDKIDTMMNKM
jgi:hypothetical protein